MPNNDSISRAAAIDAIVSVTAFPDAEYIKNLCQNPANSEGWLGGVCDAINAVEDVNVVDGWISVKDRLPVEEDYRQCHENWDGAVIWTNGSDIGQGWYYTSTGNWADIYDCKIDNVTHWMPIPEPPKEDNDAKQ